MTMILKKLQKNAYLNHNIKSEIYFNYIGHF
jgi:hypothetical protein